MGEESLEERIEKPRLWDFMVAAYSASRSIRTLLNSLALGYGYIASIAASSFFYLAAKTVGLTVKYAFLSLYYNIKDYSFLRYFRNSLNNYNPFGRLRRPHLLGTTLSTIAFFGY
ncbi:MAG TPA: hypothetical protein VFF28_04270 [Candidatus Nanoarchaeia archaeon]|nr:hypothetical protein [Candidatus Nanoarchaeia archaeon]